MADDRLHFLSIAELSRLIEGRQISPVEVTRFMLDRISSGDSRYQSYATVTAERATAAAASAEAQISSGIYLGPIDGAPLLRDLADSKLADYQEDLGTQFAAMGGMLCKTTDRK